MGGTRSRGWGGTRTGGRAGREAERVVAEAVGGECKARLQGPRLLEHGATLGVRGLRVPAAACQAEVSVSGRRTGCTQMAGGRRGTTHLEGDGWLHAGHATRALHLEGAGHQHILAEILWEGGRVKGGSRVGRGVGSGRGGGGAGGGGSWGGGDQTCEAVLGVDLQVERERREGWRQQSHNDGQPRKSLMHWGLWCGGGARTGPRGERMRAELGGV